jgi:peptidoglycan/xylan/chitin deacetylase (PgdA/CDA1 family)
MKPIGPSLWVVTYHYVRDLPHTRFPRIKGKLVEDLRQHVKWVRERCEMATLESALEFLGGTYRPVRDLCLLTFDDGLKDHSANVLPILAEQGIQGLFFLSPSCLDGERVLSVHKNHFLLASLDFARYRQAFMEQLAELSPGPNLIEDHAEARTSYPWDLPELAAFKFFLNFRLAPAVRDQVLHLVFASHFSGESAFASELYLSWDEARQMQAAGMLLGAHSYQHVALATLSDEQQREDLTTCARVLRQRVNRQSLWPFSYPFGRRHSFNQVTIRTLRQLEFTCGFTTESGPNRVSQDLFRLRRIDANEVTTRVCAAPAARG